MNADVFGIRVQVRGASDDTYHFFRSEGSRQLFWEQELMFESQTHGMPTQFTLDAAQWVDNDGRRLTMTKFEGVFE